MLSLSVEKVKISNPGQLPQPFPLITKYVTWYVRFVKGTASSQNFLSKSYIIKNLEIIFYNILGTCLINYVISFHTVQFLVTIKSIAPIEKQNTNKILQYFQYVFGFSSNRLSYLKYGL